MNDEKIYKIMHHVSYSPVIFFSALIIGTLLHTYYPYSFIDNGIGRIVGVILLLIAPLLLIYAHKHRRKLYSSYNADHIDTVLHQGPYRVSRHPVYLSFLVLMIGFAFLLNSLVLLVATLVTFLLFTFVIIPREEHLLEAQFPKVYNAYRHHVRMWV